MPKHLRSSQVHELIIVLLCDEPEVKAIVGLRTDLHPPGHREAAAGAPGEVPARSSARLGAGRRGAEEALVEGFDIEPFSDFSAK